MYSHAGARSDAVAGQALGTARSVADPSWPPAFHTVLRRLADGSRELFASDVVRFEPVRQVARPFSTVLQVRVTGDGRSHSIFIKILKPRADTPAQIASMRENVQRDFDVTMRVYEALGSFPGLTAVRPVVCFPEDLALVTEEAQGVTLARLLADATSWRPTPAGQDLVAVLQRVSAWLRAAQQAMPEAGVLAADAICVYFDRRLGELEEAGDIRLAPSGRRAIERYRDALIAAISPDDFNAVWIHADFCPENIIVGDGTTAVLDFTMAKRGTRYHDLSHLYARLESMKAKPWMRRGPVTRLQKALLDAFEPGLEPSRPLFALLLLQHVLCHLVELRTPGGLSARLSAAAHHRRHRRWLARVAGVDAGGWRR